MLSNVPPFPGNSPHEDAMLRELYSRVKRIEKTVVNVEGSVTPPVELGTLNLVSGVPLKVSGARIVLGEHNNDTWGTVVSLVANASVFSIFGTIVVPCLGSQTLRAFLEVKVFHQEDSFPYTEWAYCSPDLSNASLYFAGSRIPFLISNATYGVPQINNYMTENDLVKARWVWSTGVGYPVPNATNLLATAYIYVTYADAPVPGPLINLEDLRGETVLSPAPLT